MKPFTAISMDNLLKAHAAGDGNYHEFVKVTDMSAGLYILDVCEEDTQTVHAEDEMYYIISGNAQFYCAGSDIQVKAGASLYVAKNNVHHFHHVTEKLHVLVFFAPAET